jgi:hypothetical protein
LALGIFGYFSEDLLKTTEETFETKLRSLLNGVHNPEDIFGVSVAAFKLRKAEILDALRQARNSQIEFPNFRDLSVILDADQFSDIWGWLAARHQMKSPVKLFCSHEDGFNLKTLLMNCAGYTPTLLVIKTSSGAIFGSFVTAPWLRTNSYVGTGEMFLFTLSPQQRKYTWTGSNLYFFMAETKNFMIGGGSGVAIWLDDELNHGFSEKCPTFKNPPLAGSNKHFTCIAIEVFGLK